MRKNKKDILTNKEIDDIMTYTERVKFNKWIGGQTCPMTKRGEMGYYKWDVNRFLDMIRKRIPTYFD